jgi:hypothetical protein
MGNKANKHSPVQDNALRGLSWVYGLNHRFASNPHWDNSHCALCHEVFKSDKAGEDCDEGYTSLGGQHWVCRRCFLDFKDKLGWTIHNWD